MRVVVAPNALKGSLSALEAAEAIARGVRAAMPGATVICLPIADGGDGTCAVLSAARSGILHETVVQNPRGRPVRATFAILDDGETAVLDVATASGLALLTVEERDPLAASSRGAGQLIAAALDSGARRLIVGLGGSATVDGGAGVLAALGVAFLDSHGASIPDGGAGLGGLARIECSRIHPALANAELCLACDVDSPLLGEHGAARVFGPQKGATPDAVLELEENLGRLADVIAQATGRDVRHLAGAGAAGGIAAGLVGVLGATLEPGIDLVLSTLGFDRALEGADWVITAEGLLDRQSLRNKGPAGVARWARRRGANVMVLAGGIADDVRASDFPDFTALFSICRRPVSLTEAMSRAAEFLESTAEAVFQSLAAGRR